MAIPSYPKYTAASSDQRKPVMQFNDGSGWQTVPGMKINSVPFALEFLSSQKLHSNLFL